MEGNFRDVIISVGEDDLTGSDSLFGKYFWSRDEFCNSYTGGRCCGVLAKTME